MSRLNYDQLNMIKEKMGVDKLWSYSKVSTYMNCSWEYYLKYVKKIRVKSDNCYTYWGTVSHELIQGLYDGEHTYDEMLDILDKKVIEYTMLDDIQIKFPNDDEFQHYIANLRHYFTHVKQLPYNVTNERPVLAVFNGNEKYVFNGYIDSEFIDEDENLVIMDYKTSSISGFTGKKLIEKSKQLMIYAMGINIFGRQFDGKMIQFPLDKIKIRYDMMKYCIVSYKLKNGNMKDTKSERRLWVGKIANQIRKDLDEVPKMLEKLEKEASKVQKKMSAKKATPEDIEGYSVQLGEIEAHATELSNQLYDPIELNELIEIAVNNNNLDNMPKFVQDKYTVSDCYIDIELNTEILEEFKASLVSTLDEIVSKENADDKEEAFERGMIGKEDSFYCTNLCSLKDYCKYYKEYKENQAMFMDRKEAPSDEELLAMLGL